MSRTTPPARPWCAEIHYDGPAAPAGVDTALEVRIARAAAPLRGTCDRRARQWWSSASNVAGGGTHRVVYRFASRAAAAKFTAEIDRLDGGRCTTLCEAMPHVPSAAEADAITALWAAADVLVPYGYYVAMLTPTDVQFVAPHLSGAEAGAFLRGCEDQLNEYLVRGEYQRDLFDQLLTELGFDQDTLDSADVRHESGADEGRPPETTPDTRPSAERPGAGPTR